MTQPHGIFLNDSDTIEVPKPKVNNIIGMLCHRQKRSCANHINTFYPLRNRIQDMRTRGPNLRRFHFRFCAYVPTAETSLTIDRLEIYGFPVNRANDGREPRGDPNAPWRHVDNAIIDQSSPYVSLGRKVKILDPPI